MKQRIKIALLFCLLFVGGTYNYAQIKNGKYTILYHMGHSVILDNGKFKYDNGVRYDEKVVPKANIVSGTYTTHEDTLTFYTDKYFKDIRSIQKFDPSLKDSLKVTIHCPETVYITEVMIGYDKYVNRNFIDTVSELRLTMPEKINYMAFYWSMGDISKVLTLRKIIAGANDIRVFIPNGFDSSTVDAQDFIWGDRAVVIQDTLRFLYYSDDANKYSLGFPYVLGGK